VGNRRYAIQHLVRRASAKMNCSAINKSSKVLRNPSTDPPSYSRPTSKTSVRDGHDTHANSSRSVTVHAKVQSSGTLGSHSARSPHPAGARVDKPLPASGPASGQRQRSSVCAPGSSRGGFPASATTKASSAPPVDEFYLGIEMEFVIEIPDAVVPLTDAQVNEFLSDMKVHFNNKMDGSFVGMRLQSAELPRLTMFDKWVLWHEKAVTSDERAKKRYKTCMLRLPPPILQIPSCSSPTTRGTVRTRNRLQTLIRIFLC
jgi:hypothetical protein